MNVLMLLDEITQGKPESGKVGALLSLRMCNPHTNEWVYFSELEDQYLTEAFTWSAELSEYTFTPVHQQQAGPITQGYSPPVSSGYGGVDLSKKYPPSVWKKAKRWLKKYGWLPAALASAGITAYFIKKYGGAKPTDKPPAQRVSRAAKDLEAVIKASGDVRKWAEDYPQKARDMWLTLNDIVTSSESKKQALGL